MIFKITLIIGMQCNSMIIIIIIIPMIMHVFKLQWYLMVTF